MKHFDLKSAAAKFARDEDASLSVELVLVLPLLIWGFLTVISVYDTFRSRNLALTANYAISDLFSREQASIDSSYLTGAKSVFTYLTQGGDNTWVRVTQVYCVSDCDRDGLRVLATDWSQATDSKRPWGSDEIKARLGHAIPLLAQGARAVIVETSVDYAPPFIPPVLKLTGQDDASSGWGFLKGNTFRDIVITQPRFGPQLCWTGVNGCP